MHYAGSSMMKKGSLLIGVFFSFLLPILIIYYGNIQFGGMDGGVLINSGWMLQNGLIPYKDIIIAVPPLFFIGAKIAFFFGARWQNLLVILALFTILFYWLEYYVLRRLQFSQKWAEVIAFYIVFVTTVARTLWWYNQITSVVSCFFLSAVFLLIKEPNDKQNKIIYFISLTLILLCKVNIIVPLVFIVQFLMLISKRTRKLSLILFFLSLIASSSMILFLLKASPIDMLANYLISSTRVTNYLSNIFSVLFSPINISEPRFSIAFIAIIITLFFLAVIFHFYKSYKSEKKIVNKNNEYEAAFLGLVGVFISLLGLLTNNDYNFNETPILFLGISFFYLNCLNKSKSKNLYFFAGFTIPLIMIAIMGFYNMSSRTVVKTVGDGLFYENTELTKLSEPFLFQGMSVGPRMVEVLKDMDYVMSNYLEDVSGHNIHIFFGPRIDFGYAIYGIKPYPGLPLWWEIYSNGNTTASQKMVEHFMKAKFKMCVFLKEDYTFIPHQIIEYLQHDYQQKNYRELTIYINRSN